MVMQGMHTVDAVLVVNTLLSEPEVICEAPPRRETEARLRLENDATLQRRYIM